jgi:peptidoglycan hydrolase CwlO-like protein
MNLKGQLEHIAHFLGATRRYGKTTLTARACKDVDGVYLCANHAQARLVKREHGVHAESIEKNLQGYRGPFFIDHFAVESLLSRAAKKIDDSDKKIDELNMTVSNKDYEIESLQNRILELLYDKERLEQELRRTKDGL